MKKYRYAIGMMLLVLVGAAPLTAGEAVEFGIDASHTRVGFRVSHMVISEVSGAFGDFEGAIQYAEGDPGHSAVSVTIRTASIDTGSEDRDNHLRNADFFDAGKYPEITFVSERVEKRGEGWVAVGPLTMHGVTREIELPFTITGMITDPWGNTRLGIKGGLEIDRKDWGLTWSKTLDGGGLVVGETVTIEIALEAVKKKAPAAEPAG